MPENISAQKLIDYFEYRLQEIDRAQWDITVGEEPLFPMLVVFLGEASAKGFVHTAENLFRLWPQYQKELHFLCMEDPALNQAFNEPAFSEFLRDDNKPFQINPIDETQVQRIVSYMFSPQNNFKNKRELKIYYILDTTAIKDVEEYYSWVDAIGKSKDTFGLSSYEVSDMLLLLLDESIGKKKTADAVKNALAQCYDIEGKFPTKSVFLLSNKRSDNAICDNWQEHYYMIASIIALSNNRNAQVAAAMFSPMVKTISYAREEKPSDQIGQVVVTKVLDYLTQNGGTKKQPVDGALLLERMGITKEGTIKVLDDYIKKEIRAILPLPEQLELFPREDMEEIGSPVEMFSNEFNEKTMNAWDCFLEKTAFSLKEKLDNDKSSMEKLLECYAGMATKNFSVGELLYYAENAAIVRKIFDQKTESFSGTKKVLEAAEDKLRYLLSVESGIRERFQEVFLTQCQDAKSFLDAWDSLLRSRREVFSLRDTTLEEFYEKRLRGYFDKNRTELINKFNRLHSSEELCDLLKRTVDDIIESDELYSASFERELATRLNGGEQQDAANQYIRQKLTKEDVYTYLQSDFALPDPMLSVVMLKKGISLHKYLQGSLEQDTYYYDTGISKAAEAVKIYEISQDNLIN